MKTFALAGLLAAPLTAMAAPAWTMYAYNESVPEIHGKPINADSGFFWINKDAAAVCPDYDPDCPASNTTIISGPVYGSGSAASNTYWFMGILQQGGQQVSPAGLDDSFGGISLKYAAVGAAERGIGVWDVSRNTGTSMILDNTTVGTLGAPTIRTKYETRKYTWMACPDPLPFPEPDSYTDVNLSQPLKLYDITVGDGDSYPYCVRLEVTLKQTTLAAPQYYFCDGCQYRCDAIYGASECRAEGAACLEPYCGPYTTNTN